ncbi:MAG TPA: glucose 1-dehydrogenase [Myxococcota bacterium]|nr:glucose 1-dehydrogenase [Myxococcota bacterium]
MILDAFRLTERVVLVTGSGHGIGRAIALAYADAGANVVCAARTQAEIDETVELVRARGREALAVPCDVLHTEQLEALLAATLERFGRLDVLCNNAGGALPRPALALSERAFEKIVRFNLTSPFLLTRLAVPRMVESAGGGAVVNISSGASTLAVGGMAAYGSAKAGLNQLTRILAAEFAPKVRVNAIVVGQIDTPGASSALSPEMKRQVASNIPMKRIGAPDDVAACALYLASPASGWVTGHSFSVDGGVGAGSVPLAFPIPPL